MILAIDPGTEMGYAYSVDGLVSPRYCGVVQLRGGRFEGGGMRFLRVRRWLDEMKPKEIYYEEVRRHRGTDAAHIYGGIVGMITSWCEEHDVPYRGIPVGTIKKWATGNGRADKKMMVAAAKEKFGYEGEDHNEADAMFILDNALRVTF